jgi:hypothetical protein
VKLTWTPVMLKPYVDWTSPAKRQLSTGAFPLGLTHVPDTFV